MGELGEPHFSSQSRHDKLQYFPPTWSLLIPVLRTTRGYFQFVWRKAVHCLPRVHGSYLDVTLMFKLARAAGGHPYLVSWEAVFCALPSVSLLLLTDSSFCYTAVSAAPLLTVTHAAVSRTATRNSALYCRRFPVLSLRNFEVDLCWVTRL